ncbi:hypothetical protein CK934_01010 [Chitinophaga sp. MD30]|nr:hypothetical protein CK934_01010 [Chitinophaga sp. MD30]
MQRINTIYWFALLLVLMTGCTKVDYTTVDDPAYLRVFNDFNYGFSLDEKDKKLPFLCMLIDPVFDKDGKPTGGKIVGDFLDIRDYYAPPYPSHIGTSTSVNNPEYPGKEDVLVGPILNGYDLSSWAQIPSGTHRFLFLYRPKNSVPYFQLEKALQGEVMLDTTVTLTSHEVYTMHLLQKDYVTKENGVLLRQETFHKQSFSDSLVYVNFYNYSAKGFLESPDNIKPKIARMASFNNGVRDKMDIFLFLYPDQRAITQSSDYRSNPLPGYNGRYLASVERNNSSDAVAPYFNFPLFANRADNGVVTYSWQTFEFFVPGMNPVNNTYLDENTLGNWATLDCVNNGIQRPWLSRGATLPNMLVNIHAGKDNPRSFATINTVEVINGGVYLMTIQRKYPKPIY